MAFDFHSPVVGILLGALLLLFGRKLFWLVVGTAGFLAGWYVSFRLFHGGSEATALVAAAVCGVAGIILAVIVQKLAVGLAGFVAGGLCALNVAGSLGLMHEQFSWVVFAIGGTLGAIIAAVLFRWALIVLSSLLGAYLIAHEVSFPYAERMLVLIVLLAIGIVFQSRGRRKPARPKPRTSEEPEPS